MNVDSLRKLCLSLSGATENLQWEEELCFKVRGKIFAMVGLGSVPQRLTFKCKPETFAELTEREGIVFDKAPVAPATFPALFGCTRTPSRTQTLQYSKIAARPSR